VPKPPAKQFVGAHVRKTTARELTRLALLNDRSLAAELRIAIAHHLTANRRDEVAAATTTEGTP
jgi:hypothetical protein